MTYKKNNPLLAAAASVKIRELQVLIDTLNNTTVGSLNEDIAANATAIAANTTNITANTTAITANTSAIALINAKLTAIAGLFGLVFDINGALTSNSYTSHTHTYEDATIADTADGTGTVTITAKNTQGVNP